MSNTLNSRRRSCVSRKRSRNSLPRSLVFGRLNWVLPKGHIEIGESPDVAALRELEEEAGTIGEIVEPLSVRQFKKRDRDASAQYFLVVRWARPSRSRVAPFVGKPKTQH